MASVSSLSVLVAPGRARAHGIGGRLDLPIPLEYVIVGAGTILVASFVALAILWPDPHLQSGPRHADGPGLGSTRWSRPLAGMVGLVSLALVAGEVVPDWLGLERDPTRPTIAPVMVWVGFWLVVPFCASVIGDWYTDLNPWRIIGSVVGGEERPRLVNRLGVWPATALLISFTWMELVYPDSGDPSSLAYAAILYTSALTAAMMAVGRDTVLQLADPFTTYNRLISAISPLGRDTEGRVVWRGWLRSLPVVPDWRGLWVFVVAMIGTVSYDGASGTGWFATLSNGLDATAVGRSVLMLSVIAVIGAGYLGAAALAARFGGAGWTTIAVARRFAHTLVPIALAYAFAHYFTLVVFEGQQLFAAVSDPFGLGWDLFGTADHRVDFFVGGSQPIWYLQVASIVLGHVLGVVLAHDRALTDFGRDAVRSQYAMLVLMVALTTLGLLILSG